VELVELVYDEYDAEEVEDEVVPDTEPPAIRLVGDGSVAVMQLSTYVDEGAEAQDAVDGFVEVTVSGVEQVDTSQPGVFEVTYAAQDAAGNAASALRLVTVEALCTEPSFLCEEDEVCAVCDGDVCLCLGALQVEEAVEVVEFVVEVDVAPPTLTMLLGDDGRWAENDDGSRYVFHIVPQFSSFTDPGATAVDDTDGDVTSTIAAFGAAAVDVDVVTPETSPYLVTYDVQDAAGNAAPTQRRRVYVVNECGLGERLCASSQTCSAGGVCSGLADSMASVEKVIVVNQPPSLQLVGPARVEVMQFEPYAVCTPSSPLSAVCDRGATATDAEDGNLQARVLACSPDGARNRWDVKGVSGCGVNTTVAGNYVIVYSVYDSVGAAAYVNRTVTVRGLCPSGEVLCSDGVTCSEGGVCSQDLGGLSDKIVQEEQAEPDVPTVVLRTNSVVPRDFMQVCAQGFLFLLFLLLAFVHSHPVLLRRRHQFIHRPAHTWVRVRVRVGVGVRVGVREARAHRPSIHLRPARATPCLFTLVPPAALHFIALHFTFTSLHSWGCVWMGVFMRGVFILRFGSTACSPPARRERCRRRSCCVSPGRQPRIPRRPT